MTNAIPCSRNKDLKCNRIYKLPVSSSCLGTFYDPYSSFKLPIFTLSSNKMDFRVVVTYWLVFANPVTYRKFCN